MKSDNSDVIITWKKHTKKCQQDAKVGIFKKVRAINLNQSLFSRVLETILNALKTLQKRHFK